MGDAVYWTTSSRYSLTENKRNEEEVTTKLQAEVILNIKRIEIIIPKTTEEKRTGQQ